MAQYKIEALWDCNFCRTKGIKGGKQDCPNCGKTRGEDVAFYLPDDISITNKVQDESKVSSEADWYCDFCDSLNNANRKKCANCGCEKQESRKNYFSFRK
ncbi:MAG: hypothetical protein Q4A72_02205 [Bacillota bacterium]|nr:hypothetical protein [Bacillota bacterium]